VPLPNEAAGTSSQAATIGARPYVDSRERSIPAISRIRASPTVTTPSAEICWPIPEMFVTERNVPPLSSVPTMMSTASTGISAASRISEMATALRLRPCRWSRASTAVRLATAPTVASPVPGSSVTPPPGPAPGPAPAFPVSLMCLVPVFVVPGL
jgi:hypothetical protein